MISVTKLIENLGYRDSRNFLTGEALTAAPSFAHVFRRAQQHCGLAGVYALRQDTSRPGGPLVPVVYVCEAESEDAARQIHRRVWNQDVVPFVIVRTPQNVRVYSGFGYREGGVTPRRSASRVLNETVTAHEIAEKLLPSFHAERIDDGTLWRNRGQHVTPDMRVDWRLLSNLERLGRVLRDDMGLDPHVAHSLIGKYVYLRYLRDRDILSDQRLGEFRIDKQSVFTRYAQLSAFRSLVEQLDDWINGSVFDIPWTRGIRAEHVKEVAGAFFGDDPRTGQLNLFEDYNFSYIPIETLSVVYEQFLHSQGRGKDAGAYYTPIPLVNFILDELDSRFPLKKGMRVLDPSCGSGAFLVQCYRRLIEKELAKRKGARIRPVELRELLQDHVFGIDRDEDACQVTELSLTLTLLDYVHPPDLTKTNFKLRILRGANVFGGPDEDFFNTDSQFHQEMGEEGFDWIVGNPPWTEFSTENPRAEDTFVAAWKADNQDEYPTGGNQVAELFAWKVTEHVHSRGSIGLLLPAMTLFKNESKSFRRAFFGNLKVHSVANFANMAYVLFAGRSEVPAAAFFYQLRDGDGRGNNQSGRILTFSPLVMNQESNRPPRFNRKLDTWSVVVSGSEMREVGIREAIKGDALTWKLAMWGSHRDRRLLETVQVRFDSLGKIAQERSLRIHEGFQPREQGTYVAEIVGKKWLKKNALRRFSRLFAFPDAVFERFPRKLAHARPGRDELPIVVSRPPHILGDAARRFAVYSDEFIVVRARQPAIAGTRAQSTCLKALSLYLSSDFVQYHQFLIAPQWGVSFNRANLDTLLAIPVPVTTLSDHELADWQALHCELVKASSKEPRRVSPSRAGKASSTQLRLPFHTDEPHDALSVLIRELNDRVYRLLGLRDTERMLVEDFVHFKRWANKGKVVEGAAGVPDPRELGEYAKVLKAELDAFFEDNPSLRHKVGVQYDQRSRTGMVEVELLRNHRGSLPVKVERADTSTSADFERARRQVRKRRSQWLYFDRNLRLYEGSRVFLLKPLQRLHWLRSQALLDADTIIAETLAGGGQRVVASLQSQRCPRHARPPRIRCPVPPTLSSAYRCWIREDPRRGSLRLP